MTIFIHKADIGTKFELSIVDSDDTTIDVSSATVKYIYFKKPDGTKIRRTASFNTDGSDGIITYTTILADIDQIGEWQVQGYVEITAGKFFTEKKTFNVLETLYVAS
jgi:hypothetical protein